MKGIFYLKKHRNKFFIINVSIAVYVRLENKFLDRNPRLRSLARPHQCHLALLGGEFLSQVLEDLLQVLDGDKAVALSIKHPAAGGGEGGKPGL